MAPKNHVQAPCGCRKVMVKRRPWLQKITCRRLAGAVRSWSSGDDGRKKSRAGALRGAVRSSSSGENCPQSRAGALLQITCRRLAFSPSHVQKPCKRHKLILSGGNCPCRDLALFQVICIRKRQDAGNQVTADVRRGCKGKRSLAKSRQTFAEAVRESAALGQGGKRAAASLKSRESALRVP
jgi:hypothetical protein